MVALIIIAGILVALPLLHRLPLVRSVGQLFALGALTLLIFGKLSLADAYHSINFTVMTYLLGVFVLAQALERSNCLSALASRSMLIFQNGYYLLALVVGAMGLASAFLMNDTVAIIGTPLIIAFCQNRPDLARILLLALAYSVTIGSIMSPIGNPQNLLIALNLPQNNLFALFLYHLGLPTLLSLMILYGVMVVIFHRVLRKPLIYPAMPEPITDPELARLSQSGLIIFFVLLLIKLTLDLLGCSDHLPFDRIAVLSALPIVLLSRQRLRVIRDLDWDTLLFFVALFILAEGVWQAQVLQHIIHHWHASVTHTHLIMVLSLIGSQLISNVPWVALYLPVLHHTGASNVAYLALAAGSSLAGNVFFVGAASNVIVLQKAKKYNLALSITEFSLVGVPLTLLNLLLYMIFLR